MDNLTPSQSDLHVLEMISRSGKKVSDFSRTELKTFFKASDETIDRLLNKKKLDYHILQKVRTILAKYIDTSQSNISILSFWLLGTYFHSQFETYPLLQLYAQKRSGKTRTLKLLSSLSYKSDGSVSTSPTETHLFRHKEGCLFFDEMEGISSKERSAFRETLNAVYKKGNKIIRYRERNTKEGREYVEESFFPYYPIALANINGLGDVLADRAIQVILQRSKELVKTRLIEDFSTNDEIRSLKNQLDILDATIPKQIFTEWNSYVQGLPVENESLLEFFKMVSQTNIEGRSLELFFPLFVIAYLCNDLEGFLEVARDYVLSKEESEKVEDFDEILKSFVSQNAFEGYVSLVFLLDSFRGTLENPETWVNSKWLGRALARLGLISAKRRVNGKVQILLKNNTTNTTNTINATNTTNTTKQVELVELVAFVDKKPEDFIKKSEKKAGTHHKNILEKGFPTESNPVQDSNIDFSELEEVFQDG